VATGDMFRQAVESGSELGRRVGGYMERGELVPNELTDAVMQERLERDDTSVGFVLDGYPRNLEQAGVFEKVLERQGASLDHVVKFMVTGPEIVERLSGRWVCPACKTAYHLVSRPPRSPGVCDLDGTPLVQRDDDKEETVLHRLEVFGEQTKPLYDHYAEQGLLHEVDGIGSTDDVFERLLKATES
jgi:adenylate kinase